MQYETTMAQIGNNTGIPVPAEVLDALGGGRRPAVALEVNGCEYRSTVGSMNGEFLVPSARFDALSPSRQKAHVTSGESAKTEETRARRVAKAVAELGG